MFQDAKQVALEDQGAGRHVTSIPALVCRTGINHTHTRTMYFRQVPRSAGEKPHC